jgi:hypothetical protein
MLRVNILLLSRAYEVVVHGRLLSLLLRLLVHLLLVERQLLIARLVRQLATNSRQLTRGLKAIVVLGLLCVLVVGVLGLDHWFYWAPECLTLTLGARGIANSNSTVVPTFCWWLLHVRGNGLTAICSSSVVSMRCLNSWGAPINLLFACSSSRLARAGIAISCNPWLRSRLKIRGFRTRSCYHRSPSYRLMATRLLHWSTRGLLLVVLVNHSCSPSWIFGHQIFYHSRRVSPLSIMKRNTACLVSGSTLTFLCCCSTRLWNFGGTARKLLIGLSTGSEGRSSTEISSLILALEVLLLCLMARNSVSLMDWSSLLDVHTFISLVSRSLWPLLTSGFSIQLALPL